MSRGRALSQEPGSPAAHRHIRCHPRCWVLPSLLHFLACDLVKSLPGASVSPRKQTIVPAANRQWVLGRVRQVLMVTPTAALKAFLHLRPRLCPDLRQGLLWGLRVRPSLEKHLPQPGALPASLPLGHRLDSGGDRPQAHAAARGRAGIGAPLCQANAGSPGHETVGLWPACLVPQRGPRPPLPGPQEMAWPRLQPGPATGFPSGPFPLSGCFAVNSQSPAFPSPSPPPLPRSRGKPRTLTCPSATGVPSTPA